MNNQLSEEAKILAEYISDISGQTYCAAWMRDIEYVLWNALENGPRTLGFGNITSEHISVLKDLSDKANGWIYFDDRIGEVYVSIKSWEKMYKENFKNCFFQIKSGDKMMNDKKIRKYTKFFDMSSGGREKLGACNIFIEAERDNAINLFERIFDRHPFNITCSCCGCDYEVYETDCEPDVGDWVVSKSDIENFEFGRLLEYSDLEVKIEVN